MLDPSDLPLRPNQRDFVNRFVGVCQADDRVVAAFLGGSNVKGTADAFSDLDLCVITRDESFEELIGERAAFLGALGELVFLEDFGHPEHTFYIFADDTEGELNFAREGRLEDIHSGPFVPLVDKKNLLTDAEFPEAGPSPSKQLEELGNLIHGFWHELSHFMTALHRDQIWWAQGQLEALRSICVNLARLEHNFLDGEVGGEAYFKVDTLLPVERLAALEETFVPLERDEILQAGLLIVRFYLDIAPALAQRHELQYSHGLERVMLDRLRKLQDELLT